eukprot:TRINITY_DN78965_c0_g1_i1.p1 TRINITY_DN78965_c0_g1~~TRINITY_DN78965_c0_g1_i1.p1  ORF type:complete len:369 (+),score=60.73 TRINITY_DN78965_c0_g1_i1:45-1151(+)
MKAAAGSFQSAHHVNRRHVQSPRNRMIRAAATSLAAAHRINRTHEQSPTNRSYILDQAVDVEDVKQLDLDLPRTASGDPLLRACIGRVRAMILRHLAEDAQLGYCQGMTLVAAAFAVGSRNQEEAYGRFAAFLRRVRGLWLPGFPLLEPAMTAFGVLADKRSWSAHLARHGVDRGMFLPQAMLTLFVSWMPLTSLIRCLPFLEEEGLAGVVALAVAILDSVEPHLLEQPGFEEILAALKCLKRTGLSHMRLLGVAEAWLPEAKAALGRTTTRASGRISISRQGSQVVDEDGREALGTEAGSLAVGLERMASETGAYLSNWLQSDKATFGGSIFRWALSDCEAPAIDQSEFSVELPDVNGMNSKTFAPL